MSHGLAARALPLTPDYQSLGFYCSALTLCSMHHHLQGKTMRPRREGSEAEARWRGGSTPGFPQAPAILLCKFTAEATTTHLEMLYSVPPSDDQVPRHSDILAAHDLQCIRC